MAYRPHANIGSRDRAEQGNAGVLSSGAMELEGGGEWGDGGSDAMGPESPALFLWTQ